MPVLSAVVFASTMTLGFVVAGFMATHRNMLLSMQGTTVIAFATRTGYGRDVLTYLGQSIWGGLVLTAVSAMHLLLPAGWGQKVLFAFWIAALVMVFASLMRNEVLMARIFARWMEDQKPSGSPSP